MSRARCLATALICIIGMGLAACAPGAGPVDANHAGVNGSWRHWQPRSNAARFDAGADREAKPAEAGPDAVILALHGFNDYSNAFQDFAAYSRERNVAVHAYDQRGFGVSPDRGRWPGTDRLTADLRSAVVRLRTIYGDRPLFVLGESMGGAVAILAAAGEEGLDVDGLVLSAPAVWGGPHMNLFYRLTLRITSTIAPAWTVTGRGLDIQPSDNIDMLRALGADPLVIKATRTDAIAGLVELMDRALAAAPKLDRNLLLLIGEKDEIIPGGALDDFRSRLRDDSATAISYPEGYHMLLRDLQRARVFEDILLWVGRHSPPEGPTSRKALADDRTPPDAKVSKNKP